MAQTTIYFGAGASPKFSYSLSSSVAASATDVSGQIVSLTAPESARTNGWTNTWEGDGAIGAYGKRGMSAYTFVCVYSPASTGFWKDMTAIAEGASLASPVYAFYYPAGSATGRELVTLSQGLVSRVTHPGPDATSGEIYTYELTIEFGQFATTVL